MTVRFNGNSTRCSRTEPERSRGKIRDGLRHRIYSRTLILPVIGRGPSKNIASMLQVPLIPCESNSSDTDPTNMVVLEVGLPGDTWRYCVEREKLAEKSEWFRAMLVGPLAPAPSNPPPLIRLPHVEKRAFDHLLTYLRGERTIFQSVSTARATLDAAHQYLCPGLARLAVEFLKTKLTSFNVLEIYQGLSLYANDPISGLNRLANSPTAPPDPEDDAGQIATDCTMLLADCLGVVDGDPGSVFVQERFEELTALEVAQLARRDTLRLNSEAVLFRALDRWAASECRRRGVAPSSENRRAALNDDVWYSVRYLLMTDKEFIEGPMASGVLSSAESAAIVSRILGIHQDHEYRDSVVESLARLNSVPRIGKDVSFGRMSGSGKKERRDNRKNRRKECATQGQKTCARIGNCLVRVLACLFD
ncbi:BTB/POZ domain-containing protein 6-A isoform X2 [Prorops nasuta]|uniref:BTB/POZ domain-containing protein 6-A isoform X2 n=1 Tax=Prorops nasuta TaxID=863751 RepID=UPI0034CE9DCF